MGSRKSNPHSSRRHSSLVYNHWKPIQHFKDKRKTCSRRILEQSKLEAVYQTRRNQLHLDKGHFLAEAYARTSLEGCKLERTLRYKDSILQPSLRLELIAVRAPVGFHSSHGVNIESDALTFEYDGAIR